MNNLQKIVLGFAALSALNGACTNDTPVQRPVVTPEPSRMYGTLYAKLGDNTPTIEVKYSTLENPLIQKAGETGITLTYHNKPTEATRFICNGTYQDVCKDRFFYDHSALDPGTRKWINVIGNCDGDDKGFHCDEDLPEQLTESKLNYLKNFARSSYQQAIADYPRLKEEQRIAEEKSFPKLITETRK